MQASGLRAVLPAVVPAVYILSVSAYGLRVGR